MHRHALAGEDGGSIANPVCVFRARPRCSYAVTPRPTGTARPSITSAEAGDRRRRLLRDRQVAPEFRPRRVRNDIGIVVLPERAENETLRGEDHRRNPSDSNGT
jgi:hypothetical protein